MLLKLMINILIICWIAGYILFLLQKIYWEKVGRNYIKDRIDYKINFFALYRFFKNADNQLLDTEQFTVTHWRNAEGILFGYGDEGELVRLPSRAEANIFVAGAPGSHKTSGVVLPTCCSYRGSILAVDIKGDIYNFTKDKRRVILRFSPDLSDEYGNNIALEQSCTFDPLAGIRKMSPSERKLFVSNMSMILILIQNEKDTYFSGNARKMFCGILLFLIEECPDLTFPELLHAILHNQIPRSYSGDCVPTNIFEWIELIADSPYPAAVEQVASMIGNNEKNISGVFDRMCTSLTPLTNDVLDRLLVDSDKCISAEMLEYGFDVFLQIKQENLAV